MTSDTPAKPKYHHGDLRAALLSAAEEELALAGIEGFSLRAVAKRAGVSHAAPAHHFGDVKGLLTALAAEGFRKFLKALAAREAKANRDPRSQMIGAGLGYVDFALSRPTLFRLIYSSDKPDFADPALQAASEAAYVHLVTQVRAMGGADVDVPPVWAMAHGLADLLAAGRLKSVQALGPVERDAAIGAMLLRSFPNRET